MGKVKSELDSLKGKAGEAGESLDHSMVESRGAVVLLGEQFGVHTPREISRLIATIPGIGLALSSVLPILAAVWAVEKIIEWHKHVQEAQEALRSGFATSLQDTTDRSDELRVALAKDNAEIAVLLGKRPNTAAVTLAEGVVEADKLAKSLAKDNSEIVKLLENTSHGSIYSFLMPGQSAGAAQARDVAKGFGDALKAIPHDSGYEAAVQKATVAAWQRAQFEINKDKSDMHDNSGKDLTKDIQALQEYQQHLSGLNAEYGLLIQKTSEDTQVSHLKDAATATAALAAEEKKQLEWKNAVMHKLNEEAAKYRKETENVAEAELAASDAFKRAMEEKLAGMQELAALSQEHDQSKRVDADKIAVDKAEAAYSRGLIDLRTYVTQRKALLQQEQKDDEVRLQSKVAIAQAMLDKANSSGDVAAQVAATKQLTSAQDALGASTVKYNDALQKTDNLTDKLDHSWTKYINDMKSGMPTLGNDIKQNLQQAMQTATNDVAQSFAKMIVEGKNMGEAMRQMARSMAESFIENAIKRMVMDKIVAANHVASNIQTQASDKATAAQSQLAYAKSAAAKAFNAFAGIPIIGPELGAVAAAGAFALLMAFEQGGTIPGTGAVPIMGHGGETVVTKALTDRVNAAEGRGGSGSGVHMHNTFAPQIHAVDAEGVDRMLAKHASTFQRHMVSAARKMNRR